MVAKEDSLSVDQIVVEIERHKVALEALQRALITRAQLQAWSEKQYNDLVELAKEGIEFFSEAQVGDVVTTDWIEQRDELVARARRFIIDV
ncbi:MAG TPA: hypothetical protein VFB12_16630 [Ktedonobacteraceae bacterium]|nr:hypothetical protein [Ktedonobacteraceae bacterium]